MKFGKEFKKQMVAEWAEAYMDYNVLKRILREILNHKQAKQPPTLTQSRSLHHHFSLRGAFNALDPKSTPPPSSKGDIEEQVIDVNTSGEEDGSRKIYKTRFLKQSEEGGEIEAMFFRKLDEELNKVNAFYKDKVEEMVQEASSLNKQMGALIALRTKVEQPDAVDGNTANPNFPTDVVTANPSIGKLVALAGHSSQLQV